MRLIWSLLILALMPTFAVAQGAATLVADDVVITADGQLIANGNIEVFYEGNRLQAQQINYSPNGDVLTIRGPILITTPDGSILTADQASLDPRFENGILRGARLVLDRQLQLAAHQITRVEGRYSQLYKVAVTSCNVCAGQSPLWEIRAKSIVHDAQERQLYFTGAQFRVLGVPLAYIPRMRLPDPTLERATGLLLPQLRTTDNLGIGLKLPYFIALGDHRDLTITPYLSAKTTTVELRYRQAFARGDLEINAATSRDTLHDGTRSYVFAEGAYALGHGFQFYFDIEAASDPSYLIDYGYSEKDRLDSAFRVERVTDDSLFKTGVTYFQTLREDEQNASLPPFIGDLRYERRVNLGPAGHLDLIGSTDIAYRYSDVNGDAGRDVGRIGANARWTRDWTTHGGLVVQASAALGADFYQVQDDRAFETSGLRYTPHLGLTFEYPLAKSEDSGTKHLITPVVALVWSESYGFVPPNEDSTRNEFGIANLFSDNRFAGDDVTETGMRAAIGGSWTRIGAEGISSTLSFGRVIRADTNVAFSPSSGLDTTKSNWLLSGQITMPQGIELHARTLFDDNANLNHAAALLNWQTEDVSLSTAYLWQAADMAEDRPDDVSEITLDTRVQVNERWAVSADTRYDLALGRPARAGLGLQYRNECVTVDLSASRRYTTSTTVEPETSYGLSVSLTGFSTGRSVAQSAATCSNQ